MDSIDTLLYVLLIVCIVILVVLLWYAEDNLKTVDKWMKISDEMKQCGKSEEYDKIKNKCKKICGPLCEMTKWNISY